MGTGLKYPVGYVLGVGEVKVLEYDGRDDMFPYQIGVDLDNEEQDFTFSVWVDEEQLTTIEEELNPEKKLAKLKQQQKEIAEAISKLEGK